MKNGEQHTKWKVLGTYEGECADATITNLNGLDITRPVWETVFASDDYKKAIKLGWYIGYLGHPEDPNCMDFKNACIVMKEGRIADDGKIYGKFDLIDTPVGQIVKAFQDAGVTFGISVRGAGDITNNSVEPDTFVFRGFDLVTFPAYPDAIPTFSAIAASTDADARKNYQKVCAAVDANISAINSNETLEVLKTQFAPQSTQYKAIAAQQTLIDADQDITAQLALANQKVEAVMAMYLDAKDTIANLNKQLSDVEASHTRKLSAFRKVAGAQLRKLKEADEELHTNIDAQTAEQRKLTATVNGLKSRISILEADNLKYSQKIESTQAEIQRKSSIISDLQRRLDKTVIEMNESVDRASNLDETNRKLKASIKSAQALVSEYQDAYAALYASAIGLNLSTANVSVTADTHVAQLKKILGSASSVKRVEMTSASSIDVDSDFDAPSDDDLITM